MITLDDKIIEIHNRRKFSCFWEAFDYFKMAGYPEIEALTIGLELFDGVIWDKVINASKANVNQGNQTFGSGTTAAYSIAFTCSGSTSMAIFDNEPVGRNYFENGNYTKIEEDNLLVHLYVMTNKANPKLKSIYKAYVETRDYEQHPEFDDHIKMLTVELSSELGINLFNDGYKKLK